MKMILQQDEGNESFLTSCERVISEIGGVDIAGKVLIMIVIVILLGIIIRTGLRVLLEYKYCTRFYNRTDEEIALVNVEPELEP